MCTIFTLPSFDGPFAADHQLCILFNINNQTKIKKRKDELAMIDFKDINSEQSR